MRPHPDDPAPSPLLASVVDTAHHPSRVARPAVRRGWLEDGPGPDRRRGADEWVAVSWDEASDLVAAELRRVVAEHGNPALYTGSYGWASAGRFHHSQTQLRRFFNLIGGSTVSVGTYSNAAAGVLLGHVVGSAEEVWQRATTWPVIAAHTELLVCFGGLPAKNASVAPGGVTRHRIAGHLEQACRRGMQLVTFSPLADDVAAGLGAEWHPLRPGTDVAVMLGLAHVLISEGLADQSFLDRYCVGAPALVGYVIGREDGVAKTPEWAAAISGVDAGDLRRLARRMAEQRTLVTTSWSLQRAEHGEQPVWTSIALAALLGQIGLPGGGFGNGYGSMADVGNGRVATPLPAFPAGSNRIRSWIPVARLADALLDPGGAYDFNGERRAYPDLRLVYWSGGNPFHHHQDLNRLRRALGRPDTVVVQEPYWTAMARHADVVLPATISLERNDLGAGRNDAYIIAMRQALQPFGEARNDHDILAGLADRLGAGDEFRGGRDEWAWLSEIYGRLRDRIRSEGGDAPSFEEFWNTGELQIRVADEERVLFSAFRGDPDRHPLRTPSGRIELHSSTIAGFGYDDCPPGPTWLEPDEWLGATLALRFPLQLIANNPATRLHSQLDAGRISQASKIHGREPVRLHPADAAARGITGGDVVRLWNDRGACLAGAVLTDTVCQGVVQLSTGAWYDPDDAAGDRPTCVHGNPNVLTRDHGTSRLAQGCSGQHALVEVARFDGTLPPIRAYDPPPMSPRR